MDRYIISKGGVKEYEGATEKFDFTLKIDLLNMSNDKIAKILGKQMRVMWVNANRGNGRDFLQECVNKGTVPVHHSEIGMKMVSDTDRRTEMIKQIMLMTKCTEEQAKIKIVKMLEDEDSE